MPEAGFNRDINLPSSGSKHFRLKAKGDKIKFLIANTPHYETRHWISDRENVLCQKYNGQPKDAKCTYCEDHENALIFAGEDKEAIKKANEKKAKVDFFYPVLNLETNEAMIFQTTPSVHWTIVGYKDEGVDIFKCAWTVSRTEEAGKYYDTKRLDSVKLTEEQALALEQAKLIVLNKGQASSSVVPDAGEEVGEVAGA